MIVSVFLGPSMPLAEARDLLPGAVFRPPAQQGDLLACLNQDGANVVGLIDGTFHQNLSVWHNEVCYLLSRGIVILGASSMGALRAAETDRFGMIGVGQIYRWYKDEFITGDDEVALMHGDESSGYQSLSLPLVNIRASVELAVSRNQMTSATAARLIEIAQAIHYPDRQVPGILQRCREAHFAADQVEAARRLLTEEYVDLKKADAREMLIAIRRLVDGIDSPPESVPFKFARSSVFETLYNLDQKVRTEKGEVTLQEVVEYFAVNSTDFNEIRRASLDRSIVSVFAHLIGVKVTQEDVSAERAAFTTERGIESSEDLALWLRQNLFSESDLEEYLAQEASCRRLRAWIQSSRSLDRGAKLLADELRRRGVFSKWANDAAEQAIIVDAYQTRPEYRDLAEEDPRLLAQRHAAHTNVRIEGNASEWAEKAGFDGVSALVDALRRSVIAHDVRARIARQLASLELAESPVWETGDFVRIAESMRTSGEELVKKLGIREGLKLLDLGCGEGSTALSAARLGATVLGVDIARHFVDAGNTRAKEQGLANCKFQEGDASNLHELKDHTFDLVVSIFGAMFAPRPFDVAKEMVRVTRPGGRIVMANWIPNDSTLVAQILKISSSYSPPPTEDFISPMTWGIEDNVLARFAAAGVTKDKISFVKDTYTFNFPGAPSELVGAFRKYYAPTMNAFEAAEKSGRRGELQNELEVLFNTQNKSASKNFTSIPATFLRVAVTL